MKKPLLHTCYTYAFKAALTASLAALLFVSVPSSEAWGARTAEDLKVNSAVVLLGRVFYENRPTLVKPIITSTDIIQTSYGKMSLALTDRLIEGFKLAYQYLENGKADGFSADNIKNINSLKQVLTDATYMTPEVVKVLNDKYNIKIPTHLIPNYPKTAPELIPEEDLGKNPPPDPRIPSSSAGQEKAQLSIEYKIDPLSLIKVVEGENVDFTNVWKDPVPRQKVRVKIETNESQGVTLKGSSAGLTNGAHTVLCSVTTGNVKHKLETSTKATLLESVQNDQEVSLELILEKGQQPFPAGEYKGTITLEISGQA